MSNQDGHRIAKMMARAGYCSRREAERWIEAGRVMVNGKKLETVACVVTPEDKIRLDGKQVHLFAHSTDVPRLWRYHKPMHQMTTHNDPEGRATIFDAPAIQKSGHDHLVTVGRLDFLSEGLLLLTNHGGLAQVMMQPKTNLTRSYRVRVRGNLPDDLIPQLAEGLVVDGVHYAPIEAEIDRLGDGQNHWLFLTLREGKNREIRRVMMHFGLDVSKLIRVSYADFELGNLPAESLEEIPAKHVESFLKKLQWKAEDHV